MLLPLNLLVLLLLLVCLLSSPASGFHVRPLTVGTPLRLSSGHLSSRPVCRPLNSVVCFSKDNRKKEQIVDYNDDAFGLVFLSGLFVAQDVLFSGVFLVASAAAAIATRQGKLAFNPRIPAVVAAITLVVDTLVSPVVDHLAVAPTWTLSKDPSAMSIELAVCAASIAYGLFRGSPSNDQA